jgi:hypothetical protein
MKNHLILQKILKRLDSHHKDALTLSNNDIYKWPKDTFKALKKQGIIKPGTPAKDLKCSNCEEYCMMPVTVRPADASGRVRAFISCDKREDIGRISVDPAALNTWRLDIHNFAKALAATLGTELIAEEVKRDRMYFLGTIILNQEKRSVLFARDLEGAYSGTIPPSKALTFDNYLAPLILVPGAFETPTDKKNGTFISLRRILSVSNAGLAVDHDELSRLLLQIPHHDDALAINLAQNVFMKDGQMWSLSYEGTLKHFKPAKGLIYISYLLGSPHQEFHVTELAKAAENPEVEFLSFSSGEISTKETIADYRKRLKQIPGELKAAEDSGESILVKELQGEKEALEEQLKEALGMGGHLKKHPDEISRLAKAVSQAISRSLTTISKYHPSLWKHLFNAITPGEYLSYTPEKDISWTT